MDEKLWPNPICRNNFIDTCAFNPECDPERKDAVTLIRFEEQGKIDLGIAYSTAKELEHPNTPDWVKRKASRMICTKRVGLTSSEIKRLHDIENTLAGNGKIENIKNDAMHVFEAQKYAGDYFITTDKRILKKRDALKKLCSLIICKPSEFLDLINYYLPKQKI